jgi:small-conductance mechanosensitive channel
MRQQLRPLFVWISLFAMLVSAHAASAQNVNVTSETTDTHPDATISQAKVEIDGIELFDVLGVRALPAKERATAIVDRIEMVAADSSFKVETLQLVEADIGTSIMAGHTRLMVVTDQDARLEDADRKVIASAYEGRIRKAIETWRTDRSPAALQSSAIHALLATAVFALIVALVLWFSRWLRQALLRHRAKIQSVQIQSFQFVRAENIWGGLRRAVGAITILVLLFVVFTYLGYVLRLFPWTHGAAVKLLSYALEPLRVLGIGLLGELPNLLFLVVLFVIVRWVLRAIHLFFGAIGRSEVIMSGFEAEWAEPTYKIVRLLVIAFTLVIAYPYIPGSDSNAFKGLSLFLGVVFSLGSSSIVANMLAGYLMTYRRAFRIGDRIKIGDTVGDVSEMRVQVTHLRTPRNEEVVVPNSIILNSEIINYSVLARTEGLILHTPVGIGYETPWRQVEAMLLEAARRTPGLKPATTPFVRQKLLGDFAVTYELYVYCDNAQAMYALYTDLHRNILDVFNEFGVQIMTPAYEGDTPEPKIVPKEHWFDAPALPESKSK